MTLEEDVLELLSGPDIINSHGLELDEIASLIMCEHSELGPVIRELIEQRSVIALPFKRAGKLYHKHYAPPPNEIPVRDRIEEVFVELGIPLWVKTRVFRGAKVIFVGEFDDSSGFTIIDYAEDAPLVFRDKLAGGRPNEIVYYKHRSKYRCEKDGRQIWYNHRGQRVETKGHM